jgi:hypothetical protein
MYIIMMVIVQMFTVRSLCDRDDHKRTGLMLSRGAVESLPEFLWRIVMKLPELNLFSDESARIFLIFLCICHGFPKQGS